MIDSLAERLQQNAARFPDKAALIIPGRRAAWETITYRQLAARGELFERGLAACGLQAGMRAVLMAPPSVDFFALVFALFRRGVVSVMIDPGIGLTNVTTCLARCQPEVYFGSALTHGLRRWFGWGARQPAPEPHVGRGRPRRNFRPAGPANIPERWFCGRNHPHYRQHWPAQGRHLHRGEFRRPGGYAGRGAPTARR